MSPILYLDDSWSHHALLCQSKGGGVCGLRGLELLRSRMGFKREEREEVAGRQDSWVPSLAHPLSSSQLRPPQGLHVLGDPPPA